VVPSSNSATTSSFAFLAGDAYLARLVGDAYHARLVVRNAARNLVQLAEAIQRASPVRATHIVLLRAISEKTSPSPPLRDQLP